MDLNIHSIRVTFDLIKPRVEEFSDRFYANLSADYPASRVLLAKVGKDKQKRFLVASLVQVVNNLENPEFLGEYLGRMGESHFDYGTQDEHYDWIEACILKTLAEILGSAWTEDTGKQWTMACDMAASMILQGLHRRQACVSREKILPLVGTSRFRKAS